jgi:hypothetical protein
VWLERSVLAISNLNAAFKATQDPKSKQKEYQLIYEIVTLNQTMTSAIASIGSFINNHKTTSASSEFNVLIKISNTLQLSCDSLLPEIEKIDKETVERRGKAKRKYQQSNMRDENIKQGNTELDTETLHGLQEAYLIAIT